MPARSVTITLHQRSLAFTSCVSYLWLPSPTPRPRSGRARARARARAKFPAEGPMSWAWRPFLDPLDI